MGDDRKFVSVFFKYTSQLFCHFKQFVLESILIIINYCFLFVYLRIKYTIFNKLFILFNYELKKNTHFILVITIVEAIILKPS